MIKNKFNPIYFNEAPLLKGRIMHLADTYMKLKKAMLALVIFGI